MGTLRLLLALWVVAVHGEAVYGYKIEQAWVAVQCFFIISGFYMSLILNEKYTGPGSTRLFLSQRLVGACVPAAPGLARPWPVDDRGDQGTAGGSQCAAPRAK
jgi:hypothetical protein